MSLMKRLKTSSVAVVLTLVTAGSANAEVIRIANDGTYPPFSSIDSEGKLQGFDIEIAKALCTAMNAECELVVQDWEGIIPGLMAGKYDAVIASMAATPERRKSVDFTAKYYTTKPGILVTKDSTIAAPSAEALASKTIGAGASTADAAYVEAHLAESDLRLYPTPAEIRADLISGRIDAAIGDVIELSEFLKTEDGACCKLLGALPPDPEVYGADVSIAVAKGNDALRERFDAAIMKIRADGTYKEINDRYFDIDIYGD